MADDFVEENKLLGQTSEKLLSLRQGDPDEVDGEENGDNEETIAHLRECVKRERDQKVHNLRHWVGDCYVNSVCPCTELF